MALSKLQRRKRIKRRIRQHVLGTESKPRLCVYRSNKEISAQLINDDKGVTIVSVNSRSKEIKKGSKSEVASLVGKLLAEKATKQGVEKCCFDRNGFLYHGRVKSLAEGAREGGLKF